MLRCTVAGSLPLMATVKYGGYADSFYREHQREYDDIIRHKSYYILRRLPVGLAERLLTPSIPKLAASQQKNGMWRGNDAERITYDILAAIKHIGRFDSADVCGDLRYAPLEALEGNYSFYALLIKKDIYHCLGERDVQELEGLVAHIRSIQSRDGSWEDTVIGTAIYMEMLLDLGVPNDDAALRRGEDFLFRNLNQDLPGIHTKSTYGLVGHSIFTTADRSLEFETAARLKPEWLPRNLCFRTLAIIPDAVCLALFVRLGMENDDRVSRALDSLYGLYETYGGLCASNIKQPFLSKRC